jgi:uncharacterized protein YbjT (DUF2867 family)
MENKILVAGGTGRTGRIIVKNLLANGIHPHLLVRDRLKAETLFGKDVILHTGDVRNFETLLEPMDGVDTVISAIGTCTPVGKNCPKRVDYQGVANLVKAAQVKGIKRFILISSIAVTHPEHPMNRFGRILDWKLKGEEALRQSGLNYTIVRPGGLTDTPGGKCALIFSQGDQVLGTISREDLAATCLQLLDTSHPSQITFEVVNCEECNPPDLSGLFSALLPDQ